MLLDSVVSDEVWLAVVSVVRWSQAGHLWEHHKVWPSPHLSTSRQPQRQLNLFDHKTVIIIYLNSGGNKDNLC